MEQVKEQKNQERVQIIGAGLAGLSTAITMAENKIASNLFSLQPSERAQSVLAEGWLLQVPSSLPWEA